MPSSPPGDDRLIGRVLADRYKIMELLGEGGMGRVYVAEHVRMGRRSAVKVMSPDMARTADGVARFNREAANAARINHPNVAQIYDFGETTDGVLYLAMEFIEGETLRQIVQRRGAMAPARAAALTTQIADALEAAHHLGIVHRDLKPDNIMVARHRDGSDWVKVVDFGIAKTVQGDDDDARRSQTLTTAGVSLGTPEYMSPEQLAGERLDSRTDQYSLGLVLFNILTAKLPYPELTSRETLVNRLTSKPQRLVEVAPGIAWPPALQATLDRALAPKVASRYSSVSEFALDVALSVASFDPYATRPAPRAGSSTDPDAATVRLVPPPTRVTRKRRRWIAPVVVLAAGVVLVAAGPYRERLLPSYATNLAAAGMTHARRVANAAYDFYQFYHEPRAHAKAAPVVDTSFADLDPAAATTTPPIAMPGVVTPSGVSSELSPNGLVPYVANPSVPTPSGVTPSRQTPDGGAVVVQQGASAPDAARDSEPTKNAPLAQATASVKPPTTGAAAAAAAPKDSAPVLPNVSAATTKQPATHNWLRANGDSGAAQPLPVNAADADRIRRLGDELRGHAVRANQFMAHGDVPHVRSELHDLTGEAQVFRVLYPQVADSIRLDQLLRAAHGRLYETCQAAAADSTVSFPPNFTCAQLVPNGNRGRGGDQDN